MQKILVSFITGILFSIYGTIFATSALAHGGDPYEPKPEIIQEEEVTEEGTSLLPYAIGGSVVVVGAVVGLALWQRNKES